MKLSGWPAACAVVVIALETVNKCDVTLEGVAPVDWLKELDGLCCCLAEIDLLAEKTCLATLAYAFCLECAVLFDFKYTFAF